MTRGILSLPIAFHLFCVLLAPNSGNYLGQRVAWVVEPYINFLEIATPWAFFAPEPGPPPVYVEWEVLDRAGKTFSTGRFPELKDPFFLRERQNRRIAAVRFLVADKTRVDRVMAPYLCKTIPEAFSVRLWRVAYSVPALLEVAEGKRRIGDDVAADRRDVSHTFCEGRG